MYFFADPRVLMSGVSYSQSVFSFRAKNDFVLFAFHLRNVKYRFARYALKFPVPAKKSVPANFTRGNAFLSPRNYSVGLRKDAVKFKSSSLRRGTPDLVYSAGT